MLCCLSKRAVDGESGASFVEAPLETEDPPIEKVVLEPPHEDVPDVLLPCAICARTFMPQSLAKHTRACERAAIKRRKPFDSAKQRIQGTELAEFLPKQEKKRHYHEEQRAPSNKPKTSWKQTHDEFLRAIRAARGEVVDSPSQRQSGSLVTSGAPTRSNEQGLCPTCNRHFGIKAYERHVNWCKERSTRVVLSAAANVAKERLDARMNYRAPALKSRRTITREKYSPSSASAHNVKNPPMPPAKLKESVLPPASNRSVDSAPAKQKPATARRPGQVRESSSVSGPMKSRPADRMDRLREDELDPLTPRNSHPVKRMSYLPVPPLTSKKEIFEDRRSAMLPQKYAARIQQERIDEVSESNEISTYRSRNEDSKMSARSQRTNIVSARSQGHPKLNDVTVNAEVFSMNVQPCTIYNEDPLVTWRLLSRGKRAPVPQVERRQSQARAADVHFPEIRQGNPGKQHRAEPRAPKGEIESGPASIRETRRREKVFSSREEVIAVKSRESTGDPHWPVDERLNETYSINEIEVCRKSKLVKHSPRVEFYQKDLAAYVPRASVSGSPVSTNANVNVVPNAPENSASISCSDTYVDSRCERLNLERARDEKCADDSARDIEDVKDDLSTYQPRSPEPNKEYGKTAFVDADTAEFVDELVPRITDETEPQEMQLETETESDSNLDSNLLSDNLLNCPNRSSTPIEGSRQLHSRNSVTMDSPRDSIRDTSINPSTRECATEVNLESENIILNDADRTKTEKELAEIAIQANICGCSLESSREGLPCTGQCKNGVDDNSLLTEHPADENAGDNDESAMQASIISVEPSVELIVNEVIMSESLKESSFDWNDTAENIIDSNITTDLTMHETSSKNSIHDFNDEMENEIQTNYVNGDFNYDSDQTIEDQDSQIFQQDLPEIPIDSHASSFEHLPTNPSSSSNINYPQRPRSTNSPKPKTVLAEIDARPQVSCNIYPLRKNSHSFVSKETADNPSRKDDNREVEVINEIRSLDNSLKCNTLPDIRRGSSAAKNRHETKVNPADYWDRSSQSTKSRLISLDLRNDGEVKLFNRNSPVCSLPPVTHTHSMRKVRNRQSTSRPAWSNYVRRRPDFNLVLSGRTGAFKDYDPFLLAEQQMNELLSDTSEPSVNDAPAASRTNDTLFPLSPSSAFVKYPYQNHSAGKRASLIAPPTEFDDLTSDFSSDSTETNSLSREVFLKDLKESKEPKHPLAKSPEQKSPTRELGRRVIIDKSKALGGEVVEDHAAHANKGFVTNAERARKILGKVSPKVVKPTVSRSLSVRAASAPKPAAERNSSCQSPGSAKKVTQIKDEAQKASSVHMNNRNNNNYAGLSGSNLSLSSIVSSEVDMKRSNSVFEELMTSFEDENGSYPSLRSLLKSDSLSLSSPAHDSRQRNGQLSDEEFSSPENYKRQDHSKHSADSAYSSLNRKYSQHGRSTNEMTGRLEDDLARTHRRDSGGSSSNYKLPKFCHDCGARFLENAKFCCMCGLQRLAL